MLFWTFWTGLHGMFISGLSELQIAFLFGMVCRVQGQWSDPYYDELPADMKAYADWAYSAYAGASTSAFAPSRFFPASMIGCTLIYSPSPEFCYTMFQRPSIECWPESCSALTWNPQDRLWIPMALVLCSPMIVSGFTYVVFWNQWSRTSVRPPFCFLVNFPIYKKWILGCIIFRL